MNENYIQFIKIIEIEFNSLKLNTQLYIFTYFYFQKRTFFPVELIFFYLFI